MLHDSKAEILMAEACFLGAVASFFVEAWALLTAMQGCRTRDFFVSLLSLILSYW